MSAHPAEHTTFSWADPLLLDQQLTDAERMVRDSAAAYAQERLAPRVLEAFRNKKTDAFERRRTCPN
jgi:glutaryl-CoA dehydrogenase